MLIKAKKFVKYHLPFVLFSSFLAFFIFLTNSVNVKAENISPSNLFPYNCDEYRYQNDLVYQYIDDIFYVLQESERDSIDTSNCFIMLDSYRSNSYVYFLVYSGGTFDSINGINISNGVTLRHCNFAQVIFSSANDVLSNGYVNGVSTDTTVSVFGDYSIQTVNGLNYRYFYPFFASSSFYDVNNNLVLEDRILNPDPFVSGLDEFLDFTGEVSNTYDDSLTDIINQRNWFNNLTSTIKNAFNSLKGWLSKGFSSVVNNLTSFFSPWYSRFYNRFTEIKEGIEDFISKFSKFFQIVASIYSLGVVNNEFDFPTLIVHLVVPEVDDMYQILNQYTIGVAVNGIVSYTSQIIDFIFVAFNTPAVKVYHLPDFTLGGQTFSGYVVDFSWYDPYKPYCDAIISFFLLINYGMFLFRFAPRFFRAAGSGYSEGFDLIEDLTPEVHNDNSMSDYGFRAPSMFDFM